MVDRLLMGAVTAAVGAAILEGAGRLWRRDEASLWHSLWLAVAASALVVPALAPVLPRVPMWTPDGVVPAGGAWPWRSAALTAAGWIYVAGVGWSALRLAIGFSFVSRLARQSRRLDPPAAARVRAVSPDAARLCRVHPRIAVPMTVGVIRPCILLPEAAVLWAADRLAVVLSHELAHVRRRDYAWHVVAALHQAVYWCSPAAALIARRVRFLAELACDERASAIVGPARYAEQLVGFVDEQMTAGAIGRFAPGASSDLLPRIRALIGRHRTGTPLAMPRRCLLVAALVCVMALGILASVRGAGIAPDAAAPAWPHGPDGHAALHTAKHARQ